MKYLLLPAILVGFASCTAVPQSSSVSQTRSIADAETLSLSCSELSGRNARIEMRLRELEAESKAKQRTNMITDTAINIGLGAIIGAGARGGVSGLRTASATVQGIEGLRAAERGQAAYSEVTDVMALAQRSAVLQRAMVEKGC